MKKVFLFFLGLVGLVLSIIVGAQSPAKFKLKTIADLPVHNVASGGEKVGRLALTDLKCLGSANTLLTRFEQGQALSAIIAEAQVQVRGDLRPILRFDAPIAKGIGAAHRMYLSVEPTDAVWQSAFDFCKQVVRDADSYDWSSWFREKVERDRQLAD